LHFYIKMKSLLPILFICHSAGLLAQLSLWSENDPYFKQFCEYMTGSFNSYFQSSTDAAYLPIYLEMVRIWPERTDAYWLYVEQSMAGMRNKPYRQRIYRLSPLGGGDYESRVYELPTPEKFVYQWTNPAFFSGLSQDLLIEREGCRVVLKWVKNRFEGGTRSNDCLNNLKGASYATSRVTVYEDKLESWDQGWDLEGQQVWGAEKGAYLFDKKFIFLYPESKKVDSIDLYFSTPVKDPYRWLEDESTAETREWIQNQNLLTEKYLSLLPGREILKEKFTALYNFEKRSVPKYNNVDEYYYYNPGLLPQSILLRKTKEGRIDTILNPNTFSKDGTTSIRGYEISKDGKYLCYSTSEGGSDWKQIYFMDAEKRHLLKDKLTHIKFSGLSWYKDGIFYSRYDTIHEANKYSHINKGLKCYYHKLGTEQNEDKLIYSADDDEDASPYAYVSEDEQYLMISINKDINHNALYVKKTTDMESKFLSVDKDYDASVSIVGNIGATLYIHTNQNAPNYQLLKVNAEEPEKKNWLSVIPESTDVLDQVWIAGEKILIRYISDVCDRLKLYETDGKLFDEIILPGYGMAENIFAEPGNNDIYYSFSNYTTPGKIYKYNIDQRKSVLIWAPALAIQTDSLETKQIYYTSKDSTKIPMFITSKKGIEYDGKNPLLLSGYGGFNISKKPEFDLTKLPFLEAGGIYAVANLRGGGEYGEKWHEGGKRANKQNVFDDFIAAAEYLIEEKYTSPEKLAISGRSNGGLLIGAVMTQRPELFKVALPAVGVMDMLRYHKFTVGWAWADEYGRSDNPDDFNNLYRYSPLHNIQKNTKYPATLVTTADRDDRVVPAHSYKFTAALQAAQRGINPVLIRIDTTTGHGSGKTTQQSINENTDIWTFVLNALGIYK